MQNAKGSGGLRYDKLMLALADSNPYLSEGSRQVRNMSLDFRREVSLRPGFEDCG